MAKRACVRSSCWHSSKALAASSANCVSDIATSHNVCNVAIFGTIIKEHLAISKSMA